MIRSTLALLLTFSVLPATAAGLNDRPATGRPGQPALPSPPEAPPSYIMVRGMLARQASGLEFKPCGGGDKVMLQDPGKDSPAGAAMLDALAGGGGAFFAELGVRPLPDKTYQLLSLNQLRLPGGGASGGCASTYDDDQLFRITGWSPAYSLTVTQETLILRRPQARRNNARFPANMPTQTPTGGWHYEGTAPAVGIASYTLDINPALCRESGTGNLFGWQAILVVDGNLMAGCGAAAIHK